MSLPMFYKPLNDAYALIAEQHNIGDSYIIVDDASDFGSPTEVEPIKLSCGSSIMSIVDINGDTLTIGEFLEGTTDSVMEVSALIQVAITALDISSLQDGLKSVKSDSFYTHIQSIPSSTWVVNHNLNKFPSVFIVDSAETWVIGNVRYIDSNNLEATFAASFGGKAYLN